MQCCCNVSRNSICVYVKSIAFCIHGNRRNNRDISFFKHNMENFWIYDLAFPNPTNINFSFHTVDKHVFCSLFVAKDHSSVITCKSYTLAAKYPNKRHNFCIYVSYQNHSGNFHSFIIRNAKSLEEFSLFAHAFHFLSDFRSPTMYNNGFDSYITQKDNVFYDILHGLGADHCVSTNFDNHD
ncbi:hypothetical protein SDC9_159504 [bioreactor metagenome]|uniref:Uncharacterized protein n=1 Tax=bioreactor metagenome TaxID=1076179 RepID=A0A645FFD2_9ZZZZ